MRAKFLLILFVACMSKAMTGHSQDSVATKKTVLFAGFRFQKAVGFYWIDGLSAEVRSPKLFKQKISLGLNFVSSRLGSALGSNAIPYSEINVSALKYFRGEKPLKPLARLNAGYAHADFGSDEFADLPNSSALVSIEGGASYDLKFPLRVTVTGGYNIVTGNGMKGLGVLFPIYAQCSVLYRVSF